MTRIKSVLFDGRIVKGFDERGKPYRVCICGCDDTEHCYSADELNRAGDQNVAPVAQCQCEVGPHAFRQAYAERYREE